MGVSTDLDNRAFGQRKNIKLNLSGFDIAKYLARADVEVVRTVEEIYISIS